MLTQPVNVLYKQLQEKKRVQVWLYANKSTRLEGVILGFDEYMNFVLGSCDEIDLKKKTKKPLGTILLKGDTITLVAPVAP